MNASNPAQPTPFELPPAALNARTHPPPHHDSEEAVQYERRRISRELEPIIHHSSTPSTGCDTNLRPRYASTSREYLTRHASAISGASTHPDIPDASEDGAQSSRPSLRVPHWYDSIVGFWTRHICPTIDEGAFRDHLALERTFLGYLRTSLILVMTGILIAQLFRLQHTAIPNPYFGFYAIGLPLSVTFIGMAMVVLLVGAVRFWRLQRALIAGKAYAGGPEVLTVMGLSALLLIATFALVLGVDIDKTFFND